MKYGFIGCGNMGGALARALSLSTKDILIADISPATEALTKELGCTYGDNEGVAKGCYRIFLGLKPQILKAVLAPVAPILAQRKPLIITMAAGMEIAQIEAAVGCKLPVIRIMPNTPVAVGKGMTLYCRNRLVNDAVLADFLSDLRFSGTLDAIDEKLMDAACSLSGCGPAYMYMFLEALADGAVACGVPREKALTYAAATMAGAAEMVLSTGSHPGLLKDAVCSPGGSTIAGVRALEQSGFRGAVIDCIAAAYERNQQLGK